MYVLNNLWQGNISPNERYICSNTEYQRLFHKFCKESEVFTKDLPPEKQSHYEELQNLQLKLFDISEQDTFIVGFRLGAQIVLDIVGDYKRQFRTPAGT